MMMVAGGFRWLYAKSRILLGLKAKLSTAPAKELTADSTIQTATTAKLRAQPVADLAADKGVATAVTAGIKSKTAAELGARKRIAVGVRAGLRAYIRVGCVFIRKLFFGKKAELTTAPATEMAYHECICMATTAPAIAAESTELACSERVRTATKAEVQTSPVQSVPAVSCSVPVETTAQIGKAAAVGVGIHSGIPVTTYAKLSLAFAVDFLNADGTELHSIFVKNGENAYDPVAAGEIDAPSREDDVQYHYPSFIGWSTVPDGEADLNAMLNITGPTKLYAVHEKQLRQYTISYYDSDEGTLLHSKLWYYGETPEYTPEKDGYDFVGWTPELVPVTGDAQYYAKWEEGVVTFASASWAKIAAISESGQAAEYFAVGDTKPFTYTNEDGTTTDMEMVIIGFNHDDLTDGSGKAGITMACLSDDLPSVVYGKALYWRSGVYQCLDGTVKAALPADLQAAVKKVTKQFDYEVNSSSTNHTKLQPFDVFLFPFSLREVGYTTTSSSYPVKLGSKYAYFQTHTISLWVDVWYRNHKHQRSYSYDPCYGQTKPSQVYSEIGSAGSTITTTAKRVKFGCCI